MPWEREVNTENKSFANMSYQNESYRLTVSYYYDKNTKQIIVRSINNPTQAFVDLDTQNRAVKEMINSFRRERVEAKSIKVITNSSVTRSMLKQGGFTVKNTDNFAVYTLR